MKYFIPEFLKWLKIGRKTKKAPENSGASPV